MNRTESNRGQAARGKLLESMILRAQLGIICVCKISNGMRYVGGGEKLTNERGQTRFVPRSVAVKSACDFVGCICGTGQAIAFDAKVSNLVKGFRVNHDDHFPEHQREFLAKIGKAGAVAGAVIEAVAVGRYLWLDWRYFTARTDTPWPVIPWTDNAMFDLGPTTGLIRFKALIDSPWEDDDTRFPTVAMLDRPCSRMEAVSDAPLFAGVP